ncbi:dTDP-4-dehydrorhamnose reductase [Frisingicoccus sp.]|uniref:dTDP-4-dehydrorhamnose reductase n=1 Tax=Frisingicoccus sp. TaxID=1918627 RepID=UPI002E99D1D4|nr:dTDP-4-dehydrorhamnose reductase [Frisingicoccus sp.]
MKGRQSIWITGAKGQLGQAILRQIKQSNELLYVLSTDKDLDVTDMTEVSRYVITNHPRAIINCASITDLDECENDVVKAYKVNALGARNISAAARMVDAKIIHISTDDVFTGNGNVALTEFDTASPETVYGKSKLAGEMMVRELNPKHLVVRSSWAYGDGDNFVTHLLQQVKEGKTVEVAKDQISTPTSMDALARAILCLIESDEYGVYHVSDEGSCSRYEFAKKVLELTGNDVSLIKPVLAEDMTGGYHRPLYSVLENLMMKMTGIYKMPQWEEDLKEFLELRGMRNDRNK